MENPTANKMTHPLVSVVTPFYNEASYLADCIESVLSQSYSNFEHILINNCSTDRSNEIAEGYSKKDNRIRVINNQRFLSQVQNYNHALRQISPHSVYCKVVAADDHIFPKCIERMVSVAQSNPKVGVVGAYTLLDWGDRSDVYLTGLPHHKSVFTGRDICRRFLKDSLYVFGSPTATLILSEIVRDRDPFYYEDSVTEDVDLFFEILQSWSFGFVHDVLTYTRRSNESTISELKGFSLMQLTEMVELLKYGRFFLDEKEYSRRKRKLEREYNLMLGRYLIKGKGNAFVDFHRRGLRFAGQDITKKRLGACIVMAALDLFFNPKKTLELMFERMMRKER